MSILPSVRPTLNLQFDKQPTPEAMLAHLKSVGANFDRGSEASETATYVDSKGNIQMAPANYPRPDYDPVTGEHKGLLIEEGRENLVTQSDISGVAAIGTTTTDESVVDSDFYSGDARHIVTSSGAYVAVNASVVSGTKYALSCYYKLTAGNYVIRLSGNMVSSAADIVIDSDGTVVTDTNGYVEYVTIDNYGWGTRLTVIVTAGTTSSGIMAYFGTNNEAYVNDAQIEAGGFSTSYIPTSGSSVTRSADKISITGSSFTDFFNDDEHSTFVNFIGNKSIEYQASQPNGILSISDGSTSNRIDIRYNSTDDIRILLNSLGVSQPVSNNISGVIAEEINKYILRWDGVNTDSILNSGTIVSTSPDVGSYNTLFIGARFDGNDYYLNGNIKQLIYFPKALTDTELENLTRNL